MNPTKSKRPTGRSPLAERVLREAGDGDLFWELARRRVAADGVCHDNPRHERAAIEGVYDLIGEAYRYAPVMDARDWQAECEHERADEMHEREVAG